MANKAASHREKVIRRFENYIFPWLGSKPIADITAPQVLDTIKRIEKLGILETAHRALQTCGQVFRYGVQTGRALRDVTTDLKGALPPSRTEHMASFTEPNDVAELLRAIEGFKGTITVQCALRLEEEKIVSIISKRPMLISCTGAKLHIGHWMKRLRFRLVKNLSM